VDRQTLLWTITAFFGASIVFQAIQQLTDGESTATTVLAQVVAMVVIVAVIVAIVRLRGRR